MHPDRLLWNPIDQQHTPGTKCYLLLPRHRSRKFLQMPNINPGQDTQGILCSKKYPPLQPLHPTSFPLTTAHSNILGTRTGMRWHRQYHSDPQDMSQGRHSADTSDLATLQVLLLLGTERSWSLQGWHSRVVVFGKYRYTERHIFCGCEKNCQGSLNKSDPSFHGACAAKAVARKAFAH